MSKRATLLSSHPIAEALDRRTIGAVIVRLLALGLLSAWGFHSHAFVPITGASAISAGAGSYHTCALISGALKC